MTLFLRSSRLVILLITVALISACSLGKLKANLGEAILDNDDFELVGEGLPTYMLMMDGMVRTWPKDEKVLANAAKLYSSYAGLYVEDEARANLLATKSLNFALRAACAQYKKLCDANTKPLAEFEQALAKSDKSELDVLFALGSSWAGWIQLNTGDWNAIAQLARVRMMMERVIEIDASYNLGQAYMYMGVLHSLLPAALGGQPDEAKKAFIKAIELSDGKNMLAKVLYAKQYAVMMDEQDLFNQLLEQVSSTDPHTKGLTLQNIYAQRLAEQLKQEAAELF